ncbi:hypothetical protein TNCV_992691 [Trichonephila clavipes]|nr:hypothetical protein TNCV_992691 [Trichonephila clavipes]
MTDTRNEETQDCDHLKYLWAKIGSCWEIKSLVPLSPCLLPRNDPYQHTVTSGGPVHLQAPLAMQSFCIFCQSVNQVHIRKLSVRKMVHTAL